MGGRSLFRRKRRFWTLDALWVRQAAASSVQQKPPSALYNHRTFRLSLGRKRKTLRCPCLTPDTGQVTSTDESLTLGPKRMGSLNLILPSSLHLNSTCCYVISLFSATSNFPFPYLSFPILSPFFLPIPFQCTGF